MAGGIAETDPEKLAKLCEDFKGGAKKLYEKSGGDMWFFELYHHLTDCAAALRAVTRERDNAMAAGD